MSEENVKVFAIHLFQCIAFIHSKGLLHGNICSDKLIIDNELNDVIHFRLVDFGTVEMIGKETLYYNPKT